MQRYKTCLVGLVVVAGTLAAFYDIPFAAGFAYGLLYHVATFVPITMLGAWSAVQTGFLAARAKREAT